MKPYNSEYYNKQLNDFNNKSKLFKMTPEGVYRTQDNSTNIIIDTIKLSYKDQISGRLDGYMYKNFTTINNVPILFENKDIWMSVTPMEIDSHWIPINLSTGCVGVAGLGLGYYIQNILNKPDVKKVIVYEINQSIIDLYLQNFGNHKKLEIINQNIFEIKDQNFDFFYNDIYKTLFCDDAIDDMVTLLNNNSINTYFFWGMEGYILESINTSSNINCINKTILYEFVKLYDAFINSEFANLYTSSYIDSDVVDNFLHVCQLNS